METIQVMYNNLIMIILGTNRQDIDGEGEHIGEFLLSAMAVRLIFQNDGIY